MPPTDEAYLAEARRALTVLLAEVDAALEDSPSRAATRGAAYELRALYARVVDVVGETEAFEFHEAIEEARKRVERIFGSSGWDGR